MQLCPGAHKLGLPARERTPNELSLEIERTFKILIPLMEVRRIVIPPNTYRSQSHKTC